MKNEFANRQNMHLAVLALLADPAYQPAWKNKNPVLFTTRATDAAALVEYGLDPADATLLAARRSRRRRHFREKGPHPSPPSRLPRGR